MKKHVNLKGNKEGFVGTEVEKGREKRCNYNVRNERKIIKINFRKRKKKKNDSMVLFITLIF